MTFEIEMKNGYTGQTARMLVSADDGVESLISKASALWSLPRVPHSILVHNEFFSKGTLFDTHIGQGSKAEIVPDPFG
ncbi:MAG: hypothetical protein KAT70_09105 [Thermoplasmata archaeon]|nr:hypothetical protein [Thermoplasmata archaeon]